ncbi:MAG TPA: lipopolysaccharide biosynthesis protein [Sphingomonas sp.]|jgi:O-antigen/teichoic acid export membrane protein|nr:lipopolysaccharide biosynthesis protein [Sphingomonas sp.]
MCRWGWRSVRAKPGAARISAEKLPVADDDIAQLARGGRTSFFGFLLRLAARLPFLFIAGRWYGADALGRFAYAVIVVEFAAQLATFGLKRGLAQQLSTSERDPVCDIWDALLVGFAGAAVAAVVLIAFPIAMFPNSPINGMDRLLPLTVFGWVGSDIALAALAYRGNVGATVKARALWEPWVISIGAFGLSWYSLRDGLIVAYVLSMAAALVASLVPLLKEYGPPRGWRPQYRRAAELARSNWPLAGADACEWGSRRLDIAILGLFFSPALVGIYYVAQQVASLPQKLKTTFDPILGPVITQKLAEDDQAAVARQVRQVGFWIIAAQVGVALALAIPGEAVMGLVGPGFVGGTAALAILLAAEAVAATAVVSEAALIYVAPKRNLVISLAMIAVQAALSVVLIYALRGLTEYTFVATPTLRDDKIAAVGPALGLILALAFAAVAKAWLLHRQLRAPVIGWRWALLPAMALGGIVGWAFTKLPRHYEWVELAFGIPAILGSYGYLVWRRGFGKEDRALFRTKAGEA